MSMLQPMNRKLKGERREQIRRALAFSSAALHTPISAIMETKVALVRKDMSVEELLTFFLEHGLHDAPVVGEGSVLVGFVSLGDLVRERSERGDSEEIALRVDQPDGGRCRLGAGISPAAVGAYGSRHHDRPGGLPRGVRATDQGGGDHGLRGRAPAADRRRGATHRGRALGPGRAALGRAPRRLQHPQPHPASAPTGMGVGRDHGT